MFLLVLELWRQLVCVAVTIKVVAMAILACFDGAATCPTVNMVSIQMTKC